MIHLSQKGNNTWALFIRHLVLEKLIKAWYIKVNSKTPPFIHDLVRLAEKNNLTLDEEQKRKSYPQNPTCNMGTIECNHINPKSHNGILRFSVV